MFIIDELRCPAYCSRSSAGPKPPTPRRADYLPPPPMMADCLPPPPMMAEPCGHESVRQPDAVDHFLPHAAVCLGFPLGVRQSPLTSRPLGRKVEFMGLIEALSIGLKGDISNFDFSDDGPGAEFILTRPPRRWPRVRAAPPRPRRGGSRPPPRALQRHPPHPSRVHGWGQLA